MLLAVCCFGVCCVLCAVCCVMFVVCLFFVCGVCWLLIFVCCWFVVCRLVWFVLTVVGCVSAVMRCVLRAACCLLFVV